MKIGIFGGSFNPPHSMHQMIALDLIQNHLVDKVIYVPTSIQYNKKGLASNEDRYEMVKRMIDKNPNLEVSDYEFKKLTFTYQTLDYFQKKYPNDEIYFICGTDNFIELDTWNNYKYLLEQFRWIIIKRNEDNIEELLKKYQKYQHHIHISNLPNNPISSTQIRELLKTSPNDELLRINLNPSVLEYIKKQKLYRYSSKEEISQENTTILQLTNKLSKKIKQK